MSPWRTGGSPGGAGPAAEADRGEGVTHPRAIGRLDGGGGDSPRIFYPTHQLFPAFRASHSGKSPIDRLTPIAGAFVVPLTRLGFRYTGGSMALPPVLEVSWPGYNSTVRPGAEPIPRVVRATLDVAADDLPRLLIDVLAHEGPQQFRGLFVPEGTPEYDLVRSLLVRRG